MSLELVKDKIVLDQSVGEESVQVIVEDNMIVPDIKPDIAKILQVDGRIDLDEVEVNADRINYTGKVECNILYLADGADKPVHSWTATLPIDDFMNVDGLDRSMNVDMCYDIEHLEYDLINGRKINVKAVGEVQAKVMEVLENEVVVGTKGLPGIQVRKEPLALSRMIQNQEEKFVVKDELSVPAGKSNIREILRCDTRVANKDIKLIDGKVIVKGDVVLYTLYTGYTDEVPVEFIEHEVPFNGIIECPGAAEGMYSDVDMKVINQYVQVRPDMDGEERILDVEVVVQAKLKVTASEEIEIIEDAYCPGKDIFLKREAVKYQKVVCKNRNQAVLKETLNIDSSYPEILQIYNVVGKPKVDEIKIVEDKVVVEGIVNTKILYVAADDENPVCHYEDVVPFKQVVEAKGANLEMEVLLNTSIEHVGFNMLAPDEVEVRFALCFDTTVVDGQEVYVIVDMDEQDLDPKLLQEMPSMIIYMCQKGDTMWKVAKKYNTTVEELAELNDIENVDKIYPGQKLLILKKVVETEPEAE